MTIIKVYQKGFTLIEVVLSVVLFGIVGLLLTRVISTGANLYESITNGQEIIDNMIVAQKRFNNDTANLLDYQHVLYADSTRFLFVDSNIDTIQYRYVNGILYRAENNNGEFPIAQYLTDGTTFCYYNINEVLITENPVVSLTTIWSIRLKMFGTKGTRDMILQSLVTPQNFKYGIVK